MKIRRERKHGAELHLPWLYLLYEEDSCICMHNGSNGLLKIHFLRLQLHVQYSKQTNKKIRVHFMSIEDEAGRILVFYTVTTTLA